jgi:Uncharacterized conserved protein
VRRFLVITSVRRFNEEPYIHAKILVAGLLISNGVRRDAEVVFYLTDVDKTVKVQGKRVKRLFPDEESSVGFLKKAISGEKLPGVAVKRSAYDLFTGVVIGPGGKSRCAPAPPFTYVVTLEGFEVEIECGLGLEKLPPHHQVVIVNVNADRALYGRPPL